MDERNINTAVAARKSLQILGTPAAPGLPMPIRTNRCWGSCMQASFGGRKEDSPFSEEKEAKRLLSIQARVWIRRRA
jgi:hypothetical protein